jgi:Na+-translocating ferredoxin:NAD+ oxidoreductase RnfC subunit
VSLSPARRYSKAEKTTFQLRPENRLLCQIANEFFPGTHFLDLSDKDQQAIRELKSEREQTEAEEKRAAEQRAIADRKEARKQRKQEQAAARAAKKQNQKAQAAILQRAKDYSRLLRNLEFDSEAIERLELLAKAHPLQAANGRVASVGSSCLYTVLGNR